MAALFVTNPHFAWLTFQPRLAARRLGIETTEICLTETMGVRELENRIAAGDIDEVVFISLHAIMACGGPDAVESFAQTCPMPVTIWNVDCISLVYRSLPKTASIRYIHASPSDAAYWCRYMLPGAKSDCTYGVGPHRQAAKSLPMMAERSTALLAPINLKWSGRTLDELLTETDRLLPRQRAIFNQVFEETRARPDADIPAYVADLINDDDHAIIKVSRYAVYATQLWRREWLMGALMDYPVVLDSNFWPAHLAKRIEHCRATTLTHARVGATDDRSLTCRAVMTCSSSHDLYHDRVASGFSHGCIMVAERNSIYPFVHSDAGMLYYDFNQVRLDEIIEALASSHPDDLQSMAVAGKQRFSHIYPNMGWTRLFSTGQDRPDAQSIRRDPVMIDPELSALGCILDESVADY